MDGNSKLIGGLLLFAIGVVAGAISIIFYSMFSEYKRLELDRKRIRDDSFDRALNKFLRDLEHKKNEDDF